jgi:hypothetical protein
VIPAGLMRNLPIKDRYRNGTIDKINPYLKKIIKQKMKNLHIILLGGTEADTRFRTEMV